MGTMRRSVGRRRYERFGRLRWFFPVYACWTVILCPPVRPRTGARAGCLPLMCVSASAGSACPLRVVWSYPKGPNCAAMSGMRVQNMKVLLRQSLRGGAAIAVGMLVYALVSVSPPDYDAKPAPVLWFDLLHRWSESWFFAMHTTRILAVVPGLVASLFVYHRLSRASYRGGPTRCAACGKVMRGLTEPVCPHCGEPV